MNNTDTQLNFPLITELPKITVADLDGSQGLNRDFVNKCQIPADNDFAAVSCWLNEYKDRPATFRLYQKEAERFLLWCIYYRKKALSSLDRADLQLYEDFLSNPDKAWCAASGGRNNKRGSKNWRPFVGPLSKATHAVATSVIYTLLYYLADANYLDYNPAKIGKRRKRQNYQSEQVIQLQERILEKDEIAAIMAAAINLPEETPIDRENKYKTIFIINILFYLGLRIHELETHTWNAFRQIDGKWWFLVLGKGNKLGKIPVNNRLLQAVVAYRRYLKLSDTPESHETTPVIQSKHSDQPLTSRYMNKLLKKVALRAAVKFHNRPDKVAKLKRFSAHWLRHLSASLQDKAGIPFGQIRANLRHESDETTRRYVHAVDDDRHETMQKLILDINK